MAIAFVGGYIGTRSGAGGVGPTTVTLTSGLTGGTRSYVQAGDIVIGIIGSGSTTFRTMLITDGTTNYTLVATGSATSGTRAANLRMYYKIMGSTPDTSINFNESGNSLDGQFFGMMVFSGVDPTTPFDVTTVTAGFTTSAFPTPPSITPSTSGAFVIVAAAGVHQQGSVPFNTPSGLSYFNTAGGSDTYSVTGGFGYDGTWTSGAKTFTQWDSTITDATTLASGAITAALRPAPANSYLEKLSTTVAYQTDLPTNPFNKQVLQKVLVTSAYQLDVPTNPFNKMEIDKVWVTVAIAGPTPMVAESTGTSGASAEGVGLLLTHGTANGTSSASATSEGVYTMVPVADASPGAWKTENNSTPLYPSIDEMVPNDSDYISANPDVLDVVRFKLSDCPFDAAANLTLKYRIAKYPVLTSTPVDLIVTLQQNTTNVATWTHANLSPTVVTVTQTLTGPQNASITDYDDLYLVFTSVSTPLP